MPDEPFFPPGTTFAGFVIESVAGRGGMGVVYRARQLRPERIVALKVIAPELAPDPDYRGRFLRESEIAASIEHSNVIPVLQVGEEGQLLFIAMRYVEGTDLQATIAGAGRLEPARAVQIVSQITAALDAAHARGLVHRDVKPANVLIAPEGAREHVYLTDFGLAKQSAAAGTTQTGVFVGTIDYAAPEQFEGKPVDARTDVYAVGCVLYQMLTGQVPFPAEAEAGKVYAHLTTEPPSVRAIDSRLPVELDRVATRAMAKAPDDRYLSAGDLGRAAVAALEGKSLTRAERSVARGEAASGAAPTVAAAAPTVPAGAPTAPARAGPRLPRWLKIAGPAALGVAIVVVLVVLLAGGGGSSQSAGAHVQACMSSHGLSKPNQVRKPRPGESDISKPPEVNTIFEQRSYASCTWPPAPGANPDGYRAITVTEAQGPGESEAVGETIADRFEAPCPSLRLAYSFGSMGTFERLPPFTAKQGEIWTNRKGKFEVTSPAGRQLIFYPSRKEVDVLHNSRTRLDEVTCAT